MEKVHNFEMRQDETSLDGESFPKICIIGAG